MFLLSARRLHADLFRQHPKSLGHSLLVVASMIFKAILGFSKQVLWNGHSIDGVLQSSSDDLDGGGRDLFPKWKYLGMLQIKARETEYFEFAKVILCIFCL